MIAENPAATRTLLTDEQMRQFFTHGFLVLQANVPDDVNKAIFDKLDHEMHNQGHAGNNMLPMVPELAQVFEDPTVAGAIESVVGEDAIMHPHRATHYCEPGRDRVGWHKDSYWGYRRKMRQHRPWWAMVMYYPQDVAPENGPTAVLPGRQHHLRRPEDDDLGMTRAVGKAGTFILIHYDIWHTATPNTSDRKRYMCKFEFVRMSRPTRPAWDCRDTTWHEPANLPPFRHRAQWRMMWDWAVANPIGTSPSGSIDVKVGDLIDQLKAGDVAQQVQAADALGVLGVDAAEAVDALAKHLGCDSEPLALNAAYGLAAIGAPAEKALFAAMASGDEHARRNAAYALPWLGDSVAHGLIDLLDHDDAAVRADAVFALGEIDGANASTIAALARSLRDSDETVRIRAADGLGTQGSGAVDALPSLIDTLSSDEEPEARFNAALALARMGEAAEPAVPALIEALSDSNRYVPAYSLEALERIDTPAARTALIKFLKTARWCPVTKHDSPFYP